jgi:tight adherence protein B
MIALVLAVFAAVFAVTLVLILAFAAGPSKEIETRLQALTWESSPTHAEETATNIRREERVTGVEWLNRWLTHFDLADRTRLLLRQAGVATPPEKLLALSLAGWAALGYLVWCRTGALLPAVFLSATAIPAPLWYVLRRRAKRLAKFEQQLPEALDMLVSALQVGHSLVSAMGALGRDCAEPVAGEFRTLFDEQNFGVDLRTAMTNLATRVPVQDVRIFVAAALIQKESGGNLAEVLSRVALTTRERFRLKKQISVHTAQGRLTGWVLSILPVALGLGMYLVNPAEMSVLWTNPTGLKMLYTAAGMIVAGSLIIRRIVRIRV